MTIQVTAGYRQFTKNQALSGPRREITPKSLALCNVNMEYAAEPGECEVMVGSSSRDQDLRKVILTVQV
jgi:hypothetical protein